MNPHPPIATGLFAFFKYSTNILRLFFVLGKSFEKS